MEANLASITDVVNKSFDYIIAGGGTAGLCLAARLTEDPQVTVLVLEAGGTHLKDPLVDTPTGFLQQMGNPKYDWGFKTTPQKGLENNMVDLIRGKGLGGSSNINILGWNHPSKEDIDAWERLGNPGWNFEMFLPYVKKAENFHIPTNDLIARENICVDPTWYGHEGPVPVSFSDMSSEVGPLVREALKVRGIPTVNNANGKVTGAFCSLVSVDSRSLTRSSAFTAYLLPNAGRKNLQVLTEAYVNRIVLDDAEKTEPVSATGVEFRHVDKVFQVQAKKEVILCAGALKSPQILELSGIGDPAVLQPLGIDVKVDLPGVGTNLQVHLFHSGLSYELREGADVQTLDVLSDAVEREKHMKLYAEKQRGLLSFAVSGLSFLPVQAISKKADKIVKGQVEKIKEESDGYPAGRLEQFDIQAERLNNPSLHEVEIITNPVFGGYINKSEIGKKYVTLIVCLVSAWSRGSLHISSKDPSAQPPMDPHYFEEQIDLELMVELFKFNRSLTTVEPLKSLLMKEVNPGPSVTSDAEVRDYIKQHLGSLYHDAGTLSMLPREKRGVVDPELRVWGTKNIRVVDISIIPLHVGVHPQAVVYGIAERAADIIKGRA